MRLRARTRSRLAIARRTVAGVPAAGGWLRHATAAQNVLVGQVIQRSPNDGAARLMYPLPSSNWMRNSWNMTMPNRLSSPRYPPATMLWLLCVYS